MVHPYSRTGTTAAWKKLCFILSEKSDFHMIDNQLIAFHTQQNTITDVDYADDIALLAKTPTQAESLLHSLVQAADGIGFMWMQTKRSTCDLIRRETH